MTRRRPSLNTLRHHLRFTLTPRGTMMLPELPVRGGGALHLSESSVPIKPHVWLRVSVPVKATEPLGERHEVVLHVSLDDLALLVDQCNFMREYHWREQRETFTSEGDTHNE